MYALEIDSPQYGTNSEQMLLRRPRVTIGSGEHHNIVLEEFSKLGFSLVISRRAERGFHISVIAKDDDTFIPAKVAGDYEGETTIDLKDIQLHITALDLDLFLRDEEPFDKAGVRILREAASTRVMSFPAIYIPGDGEDETIVSFLSGNSLLLGRSEECSLRFDLNDISAKHARIGYESGEFWVEDLGSTNGTFVGGNQISGKIVVPPGQAIVLGKDITVFGLTSSEQIEQARLQENTALEIPVASTEAYPVLYSLSEVARPARYALHAGYEVKIGREPTSDIWLGVPHISRKHCTFILEDGGEVVITDYSKNGVTCNGVEIGRGRQKVLRGDEPAVLNFGASVNIALCFSEEHERSFLASDGDTYTFAPEQRKNATKRQRIQLDLTGLNSVGGFKRFYRSLSFPRKLFLLISIFLVLVVLLFFIKLLIPVFR